jgi:hypothetical protein
MLMTLYAATVDFASTATADNLAGSGQSFGEWTGRIFNAVFVFALLLLLIYLIWGAISWLSASGDSSKVQAARDKMTQAVVGVIVLAATFAIFMLIQTFLGVEIFTIDGVSGVDSSGGTVTTETRTPTRSGNYRITRE